MADRLRLALVFHQHQPAGNFPSVFSEVTERCYSPLVAALYRHPEVKATLHFSGPLLGPYAWRRFVLPVRLAAGSYAITSRAIAYDGTVQPELRVENERAYGHNGWRDHAVKVTVA